MAQALRSPIKVMNNHQKEWLATAMVAMVLADGTVSQGEVQSLMQSISFVQEPETVDRLKKHIQFQTSPPIPAFAGWEKEAKYRAMMLLDLMEVAISDRDFSPPEKAKFYEIGRLLGFNKDKIDQLVQAGDKFAGGSA